MPYINRKDIAQLKITPVPESVAACYKQPMFYIEILFDVKDIVPDAGDGENMVLFSTPSELNYSFALKLKDHEYTDIWSNSLEGSPIAEEKGNIYFSGSEAIEVITKMFPDYVGRRGVYYRSDQRLTQMEGDELVTHPVVGVVFRCMIEPSRGEETKRVIYECLDRNEGALNEVRLGIEGKPSPFYRSLLVRRSTPDGWHYYPLWLLFETPETRRAVAENYGKTPPPEKWVRRRSRVVAKLLGESLDELVGESV